MLRMLSYGRGTAVGITKANLLMNMCYQNYALILGFIVGIVLNIAVVMNSQAGGDAPAAPPWGTEVKQKQLNQRELEELRELEEQLNELKKLKGELEELRELERLRELEKWELERLRELEKWELESLWEIIELSVPAAPPWGTEHARSSFKAEKNLINDIQKHLNSLGYDAGPVDGILGPRTKAAISDFQNTLGIDPTGQPSQRLLVLLKKTLDEKHR